MKQGFTFVDAKQKKTRVTFINIQIDQHEKEKFVNIKHYSGLPLIMILFFHNFNYINS